jgi:preprotein translocase subunit SecF
MKATHSEDLEFLREIRGRFQSAKSQRQSEWGLIIVFMLFGILCCLTAIFSIGNKYRFGFGIFALGEFLVAIYVFLIRAVEYEFTGEEIIERRAGKIKNQIRISDIVEMKVKISPHQLIVKTNNSKMIVRIPPSLNEVIQKKGKEMMAQKSEAEQQHFEKVKQETSLRLKRASVIGFIIFILVMLAFWFLAFWLKQKRILP